MQNPMLNLLQGNQNNIMMQAIGAMMRGESPQDFMKGLAQSNPALKGLDLDNLNQTAEMVCRENNVDLNNAKSRISQYLNGIKQ